MMPVIGNGIDPISKVDTSTMMKKYNVVQMTNTALKEVKTDCFIVEDAEGIKTLDFDYGFVCLGMKAATPLVDKLQEEFGQDGNIEILNIGDSFRARRIIEGVEEGRNIISILDKRDYL